MKGYSAVKKVVQACFQCKVQHKRPMQQQMAPLPPDRTQVGDTPFTFVGLDYFGPFQVKQGRSTPKRWGCLFTCLVTRAVHIEVAHSLSAESFLLAFHRFMARRGKPAKVYSDNGTNFIAGEKELREEFARLNTKQVYDDMLLEAIDWKFIPAHSSYGGSVGALSAFHQEYFEVTDW